MIKKITIVIAQPRSGSTLLMRLINNCTPLIMSGDRQPEVYQALLLLHEHRLRGAIYGLPSQLEEGSIFCDHYNGFDEYTQYRATSKIIIDTLSPLYHKTQYLLVKTGILGFGNEYLVPFVKMMRERFENVKFVYLTRDHSEIVNSMLTTNHPMASELSEKMLYDFLLRQHEQILEAYQSSYGKDSYITYDSLCELPEWCISLVTDSKIYTSCIAEVMGKKLRDPAY